MAQEQRKKHLGKRLSPSEVVLPPAGPDFLERLAKIDKRSRKSLGNLADPGVTRLSGTPPAFQSNERPMRKLLPELSRTPA